MSKAVLIGWIGCMLATLTVVGQGEDDQQRLQVITKRITKTFPYSDGFEVNLEGENAEVLVESWGKKEIYVQIELIAKHPDKAQATKDLERMAYLLDRAKNNIYIRNYVQESEKTDNTAVLEARYIIRLPESCPVYIKNQFGETDVRNLTSQLRIFNEFGNVDLFNITGGMEMRTKFSEVRGAQLVGDFDIFARRSQLDFRDVVGNYNITAEYSTLNLWAGEGLIDLNIDAKKTDVQLFNIDPKTHQHQLVVQHGNVVVPNAWQFEFEEDTPYIKKLTFQPNSEYFATITVNISFGDLKIERKQ
ncbi:MAG: hypothetical protein AAGI23_20250 [Bacteroidota bacterium]